MGDVASLLLFMFVCSASGSNSCEPWPPPPSLLVLACKNGQDTESSESSSKISNHR